MKHKMTRSKKQREKDKEKQRRDRNIKLKIGEKPKLYTPQQHQQPSIKDIEERIMWLEYFRTTLRHARNKRETQLRFIREDQLTNGLNNLRVRLELEKIKVNGKQT